MNIEKLLEYQSLEGQVAIVTGASRPNGQGLAIAKSLAIRGAKIVLTDIPGDDPRYNYEGLGLGSSEQLEVAVEEVKALGAEAIGIAFDVTVREEIKRCVEQTIEAFGRIDILVNNAGSLHAAAIEDLTDEMWDASYRINMKALSDFAAEVVPYMRKQGGGCIVNNTSVAGLQAWPNSGCYTATKHGAVGISKVMAKEFGPDNIRVNAVCQGNVWTDISQKEAELLASRGLYNSADEAIEDMKNMVALGDYTMPEDIAEGVAFLTTKSAKFITGITLQVDGGI